MPSRWLKYRKNFVWTISEDRISSQAITKLAEVLGTSEFERKLISFVIDRRALFYHRINERKIREIHGDLYLKNIFVLYPKFYLYDRIEFNDSLRYADIAEDVAHLSVDLDYYQRSDRRYFLSQYIKKSKDQSLEELVYFLMCYKACVRAKVSFRAKQERNSEKRIQNMKEANEHLHLAASYFNLF